MDAPKACARSKDSTVAVDMDIDDDDNDEYAWEASNAQL